MDDFHLSWLYVGLELLDLEGSITKKAYLMTFASMNTSFEDTGTRPFLVIYHRMLASSSRHQGSDRLWLWNSHVF